MSKNHRPTLHLPTEDHFKAIRRHIAELTKTGDEDLNNALKKIIVRLDRIEGKL